MSESNTSDEVKLVFVEGFELSALSEHEVKAIEAYMRDFVREMLLYGQPVDDEG